MYIYLCVCIVQIWKSEIEIFLSNVMGREKQFFTPNRVTSIIHSIKEG